MKPLKRFLIAFLSVFITFFTINILNVSAASFPGLETKIIAESNTSKIIKLQTFLQKLDLYSGNIDGKYETVLPSLLSYQKQTGLISHDNDWGAGYFGVKTLTALQEDYPEEFEKYKYILEQDKPVEGERYFYVTAYYSPLPGQSRYTTGSYAGDIRLNGGGKRTASGKGVFPGLLAGPRNYDYGTKIELDGIGIGSVEDRGGAIVNAGERGFEYDRIDIWMGYGDEGLVRALKWGKRKVKGKIVSDDRNINVAFNESIIASYSRLYVKPDSNKVDVEKLQKLFTELNLYDGEVDGNYLSIKDEIVNFQLKYKIISSKYEDQAGYFGPKTIAVLKKNYSVDDSIFKAPFRDPADEFDALTRKEKLAIVRLRNKLDVYISKQAKGNKVKIQKQKTQLQNKLDKVIKKSKNKNKKQKLQYLKIIL